MTPLFFLRFLRMSIVTLIVVGFLGTPTVQAATKCSSILDCDAINTNKVCVFTKYDGATNQFDTTSGICVAGSVVSSAPSCSTIVDTCGASAATQCVGVALIPNVQPTSEAKKCLSAEYLIVADTAEQIQTNSAAAQETILAAKIALDAEKEQIEKDYQAAINAPGATEKQKQDALVARDKALADAAVEYSVIVGAVAKTLQEANNSSLNNGALAAGAVVGAANPRQPLPATLNVPIPGVVFSNPADISGGDGPDVALSIPYIGQYIAGVFQYSLYVLAGLAVFVVMFAGVRWILARGNASEIKNAKEMITGSIVGLMIALMSYSMLQIIDPRLTTLSPISLDAVEAEPHKFELSATVYAQVTGGKQLDLSPGGRSENAAKAAAAAAKLGIPSCLAQVIVKHESGGNPAVIGHDENYCGPNYVGSRFSFLRSGKTFQGKTFESSVPALIPNGSDAASKALRKKIACVSQKNDDGGKHVTEANFVPPDFGIDWRFSHGIGLGQVTFGDGQFCNVNGQNVRGTKIKGLNNRCLTVPELLSVDTAVEAMAGRLLSWYKKAGGVPGTPQNQVPESVIRLTFAHYGKGNDPGDLYRDSVNGRVKHYLECVKGTGSSAPETSTGEKLSEGLPAAEE